MVSTSLVADRKAPRRPARPDCDDNTPPARRAEWYKVSKLLFEL